MLLMCHEEKETDKRKALLALWEGLPVDLAACPCHSADRRRSRRAPLSPGAAGSPDSLPVPDSPFVSGFSGCFSVREVERVSVAAAAGEVISDSELENFYGEWNLTGWILSGLYIPLDGFGITGTIDVEDGYLNYVLFDEADYGIPYEFEDGSLYFEHEGQLYIAEIQDGGKLRVELALNPEEEISLIFGR